MGFLKKLLGLDDEPKAVAPEHDLEAVRNEALGLSAPANDDPEMPIPALAGYRWRLEDLYGGRYELKLLKDGTSEIQALLADGETYGDLSKTREVSKKVLTKTMEHVAVQEKIKKINGAR